MPPSAGTVTPSTRSTATDAVLDYPQSGERFSGRSRIQGQRGGRAAERHFTIRRILGGGDLWVSECVITYDGVPTCSVSIMEFADGLVSHETQYFADPFDAAPPGALRCADPQRRRIGGPFGAIVAPALAPADGQPELELTSFRSWPGHRYGSSRRVLCWAGFLSSVERGWAR